MSDTIDREAFKAFADRLRDTYVRTTLAYMIDVGHQTGLFEALTEGPATSAELAERAGLSERHVREWLGAMATGAIADYDPDTGRHTLPPERALLLTGDTPMNMAVVAAMVTTLGKHVPAVVDTFRDGGGLPYSVYRPEFTSVMAETNRRRYEAMLVKTYVPLADGLPGQLADGARVVDIGCGTGHTTNLMAEAFPASEFLGVDIATDAIDRARAEAGERGLGNASFEVMDILDLPTDPGFDVAFAFDVVHDQVDPVAVLDRVSAATGDHGRFFCLDINAHSDLADNLDDPKAAMVYGLSTMHCMQVSLAHDGAGLGTAWGRELAESMLRDAGWASVDVHDLPADPFNVVYDCRKS